MIDFAISCHSSSSDDHALLVPEQLAERGDEIRGVLPDPGGKPAHQLRVGQERRENSSQQQEKTVGSLPGKTA
jgi:hypothetical protein